MLSTQIYKSWVGQVVSAYGLYYTPKTEYIAYLKNGASVVGTPFSFHVTSIEYDGAGIKFFMSPTCMYWLSFTGTVTDIYITQVTEVSGEIECANIFLDSTLNLSSEDLYLDFTNIGFVFFSSENFI